MGINLTVLMLLTPSIDHIWLPHFSLRSELLSSLFCGIISDPVGDVFVNPASIKKNKNTEIYYSSKTTIRKCIVLTPKGGGYLLISKPSPNIHIERKERDWAVIYGKEIKKVKMGIGYNYRVYQKKFSAPMWIYFYEICEKTYTIVGGVIFPNGWSCKLSGKKRKYRYSEKLEEEKTIEERTVNLGVGKRTKTKERKYFSLTYSEYIDTTFHYKISTFARLSNVIATTSNAKVYGMVGLEVYYFHKIFTPWYSRGKYSDLRCYFPFGFGVEHFVGKVAILGSFTQWLGYSFLPNKFLFFSTNPVKIGMALKFEPLTLWVKLSNYLFQVPHWEIKFSYTLFGKRKK